MHDHHRCSKMNSIGIKWNGFLITTRMYLQHAYGLHCMLIEYRPELLERWRFCTLHWITATIPILHFYYCNLSLLEHWVFSGVKLFHLIIKYRELHSFSLLPLTCVFCIQIDTIGMHVKHGAMAIVHFYKSTQLSFSFWLWLVVNGIHKCAYGIFGEDYSIYVTKVKILIFYLTK